MFGIGIGGGSYLGRFLRKRKDERACFKSVSKDWRDREPCLDLESRCEQ